MRRRTFIRVAGNPLFRDLAKPNRLINSPVTSTPTFCVFPALKAVGREFAAGPIHLREGRHGGPNNGYGFQHIWKEHFSSELDPECAKSLVVAFVAEILRPGSHIYYEGGIGPHEHRSLVWRNAKRGVVILEERLDAANGKFYSVVTAYPARSPRGVLIGSL